MSGVVLMFDGFAQKKHHFLGGLFFVFVIFAVNKKHGTRFNFKHLLETHILHP